MEKKDTNSTPAIVQETIDCVIKKMRYRRKVRADVRAELEGHFEDALADCTTLEEQGDLAEKLIVEFGDTKVLGALIRRAKKRCRPVWVKGMIRLAQVMGVCVLYFVLCLSRLMIGSPTIKVDTIAQLNKEVKQGREDTLNALPDIEKAIALLGPKPKGLGQYPPYRDMNDVQRQGVEAYLTQIYRLWISCDWLFKNLVIGDSIILYLWGMEIQGPKTGWHEACWKMLCYPLIWSSR